MEKKERAPRVISDATLDRYLSAILLLRQRLPIVRSVDVANHLGYSKACVSMAVKQMTREALVSVGSHGALTLTDAGERRGLEHRQRCDYFHSLLLRSGVEDDAATADASAITRAVSGESYKALRRYLTQAGVPAPQATGQGQT